MLKQFVFLDLLLIFIIAVLIVLITHYYYVLDVHPNLASLTVFYSCDYIESIESNTTLIHLPDKTCNDLDYSIFNFSRFSLLEELEIGDDSFSNVNEFVIDGLYELKYIKIGINSFSSYDEQSTFQILNCDKLESIEIGRYSFSNYGGLFELVNLPKLSTIKVGEIGIDSSNFYYSSFVIQGIIDMILLMNRSSTFGFH